MYASRLVNYGWVLNWDSNSGLFVLWVFCVEECCDINIHGLLGYIWMILFFSLRVSGLYNGNIKMNRSSLSQNFKMTHVLLSNLAIALNVIFIM